jgi:hypothetical protein|tara:strand:- start:4307 stop:4525 length:219 start_codon:yes stop_codon:yes gene_type:complete
VPVPVIAAHLSEPFTRNKYGVSAAMYVEVVAAVGDAPKATKQAAVAVTITACIWGANADVAVAPLEVVALNV